MLDRDQFHVQIYKKNLDTLSACIYCHPVCDQDFAEAGMLPAW